MLSYNIDDVWLLQKLWEETRYFGEDDVMDNTLRLNREGVRFDQEYLVKLDKIWNTAEMNAGYDIERLTGGMVPANKINSHPKMRTWIESVGVVMPGSIEKFSIDKRHVDQLESKVKSEDCGENDALVLQVLKLRQTATGSAKGKITSAITKLQDETLRPVRS